jgi:hypothetical protein
MHRQVLYEAFVEESWSSGSKRRLDTIIEKVHRHIYKVHVTISTHEMSVRSQKLTHHRRNLVHPDRGSDLT